MTEKGPDSILGHTTEHRKQNEGAIRAIRGCIVLISTSELRRAIVKWCIDAEAQVEDSVLAWHQLLETLKGTENDLLILRKASPTFDKYVQDVESGAILRLSNPDVMPAATAENEGASNVVNQGTAAAVRSVYRASQQHKKTAS